MSFLISIARSLKTLKENNITKFFSFGYVYGVAETATGLRSKFERADELMYEEKRMGKMNSIGEPYR